MLSGDRNRQTTNEQFAYYQCERCALVFMDPIPDDLSPFYAGGYQALPENLEGLRAIAKNESYRLEPVLRYKRAGQLLEIGPWMGIFAVNARDAGFSVSAIEIDERCVRFLRDVVGIDATQSADPVAALRGMQQSFDVIVLWHCLEHLREPWKTLEEAAKRLKPGGILLVSLPNIESFEFTHLQDRWINLDTPRHLYFYPRRSLRTLMNGFGLVEREARSDDRLSSEFRNGTWAAQAQKRMPVRGVRRVVFHAMRAWALRQEAKQEDAGPSLTAVFERPR